jgi:hypothetical protein
MATLISGEELIGLAVVDATHPKLYMGYIYIWIIYVRVILIQLPKGPLYRDLASSMFV